MNDERHSRITALCTQNRHDEATRLCMDMLDEDHSNAVALFQLGTILLVQDRKGLAYNVLARACKLSPEHPEMWLNYGRAHPDRPSEWGRSEWCIRKALKLFGKEGRDHTATAHANLAMLAYIQGKMDRAQECVSEALSIDPSNQNAMVTQGFVHLAKGEWAKAWHLYDVMLRTGKRVSCTYGDEPEWDGSLGKRLIISGEQGIGDEIMYASCFGEVIADCDKVVIECMPRLQKLFQRSFPGAKVYGTRWDKEVFWEEDHNPEAHVAMATLPRFYRHTESDFPGGAYLKPNPSIVNAVKGLLGSLGRSPKVGIAWTGGTDRTRSYLRKRTLKELLPILNKDVTWISLEYNDRQDEIVEFKEKHGIAIKSFPWLTDKGLDYDLTAALVSELDLVISVPTTVTQMAGAVGVECWVMVPRYTGWIFARDEYPWAKSVVPLRNTPISEIADKLESWLSTRIQTLKPLSRTG